jgi:flavin reductase (DIM6/NTAB) family NADH-FMN oxidoreductase RutF
MACSRKKGVGLACEGTAFQCRALVAFLAWRSVLRFNNLFLCAITNGSKANCELASKVWCAPSRRVRPTVPTQQLEIATMAKRSLPLSKVYGLLESGPVVLISTAFQGRANIMTQSWHTMMEFEPPLVGCVVSSGDYSFAALKTTRECVLNIPTAELAQKVVACGNSSGSSVDKFEAFGLTQKPATLVAAPLIAECYASLECRVADTRLVNRYNFFVLEVVKAWVDTACKDPRTLHHRGKGLFMVAGDSVKLPSKMK